MRWDPGKSARLKRERGVSFEEIVLAELVAVMEHGSRRNQRILLFRHEGYIWVVPYVYREGGIFLKTLFPSRKYTRKFMKG
ncbi:MAG TPA: BrnT family toxin [Elusimicrobiales bacterium]|nr:BrnT family toxin [Elusimicrobiales bacterium]